MPAPETLPVKQVLFEDDRVVVYKDYPMNEYVLKPLIVNEKELELVSVLVGVVQRVQSAESARLSVALKSSSTVLEGLKELEASLPSLAGRLVTKEEYESVKRVLSDFVSLRAKFVSSPEKLVDAVLYETVGYGVLSPLLFDDALEEIAVNNPGQVFIYHRKFGVCKTTVAFESASELYDLIRRISKYANRELSDDYPLLDASFPDGSRVNATIPPASPKSPTLTIRKFTARPVTLVDIISNKSVSSEIMALLWVAVEGLQLYPLNIMVCGGGGSGKTTLLNALSSFIPKNERVITVEDTLEVQMWNRDNWVQMLSKPAGRNGLEITMNDLVKNSLRMRSDRLILGEVRGGEALTIFNAMNAGTRGFMGTLHSNTAAEVVLRVTNPPMNVPKSMVPLIDLIVIMSRMNVRGKGTVRRLTELSEVSRLGEDIGLNALYSWDQSDDVVKRSDVPAKTIEVLAKHTGHSKNEVLDEIARRKKVLDWMADNRISDLEGIDTVINAYCAHPELVLKKVADSKSRKP